jgi:hypothetical protein
MATQSNSELIAAVLQEWLNERMHNMKLILANHDITERNSMLVPSITITAPNITENNINAQMTMEDYYVFIDKGVKGIGGGYKNALEDGVYAFKNRYVGRKMVDKIGEYITRRPDKFQIRTSRSQSGADVLAIKRQVAWGTAVNVKKHGIGRTRFFTDSTTEKFEQQLADRLADRLGQNFEIKLSEV